MMNKESRFSISPHVSAREVGDELVLLNLESGVYFGLDPVGLLIWRLLGEGKSLCEICDHVLEAYAADRETAERDARTLIEDMMSHRLVAPA